MVGALASLVLVLLAVLCCVWRKRKHLWSQQPTPIQVRGGLRPLAPP